MRPANAETQPHQCQAHFCLPFFTTVCRCHCLTMLRSSKFAVDLWVSSPCNSWLLLLSDFRIAWPGQTLSNDVTNGSLMHTLPFFFTKTHNKQRRNGVTTTSGMLLLLLFSSWLTVGPCSYYQYRALYHMIIQQYIYVFAYTSPLSCLHHPDTEVWSSTTLAIICT